MDYRWQLRCVETKRRPKGYSLQEISSLLIEVRSVLLLDGPVCWGWDCWWSTKLTGLAVPPCMQSPHCWRLNRWLLCQLQIVWWCCCMNGFCARISPSKHLEMRTYSFYESLLFLQDVSKRMSLPMDIRLPPEFLKKLQMENENSPLCKPLSRMSRRASLVSDVSVFVMFVCLFNRTFSF